MAAKKIKYTHYTTAEEVAEGVDLSGKNAIVTGGYSGVGRETARVFALQGAQVFVIGRDMPKCNRVVEELKKETDNSQIHAMECDLASFESVRAFGTQFNNLNIPLHYLFNNAGVMVCPESKTKDGFETQFGVNHLGHFLLTNLVLPRLVQGAPSRVINVSSSGHLTEQIRWDDFNFAHGYDAWKAYGQSKTANILMAIELSKRYKDQGVTAYSLHPGWVKTELERHDIHIPQNSNGAWKHAFAILSVVKKYGMLRHKNLAVGAMTSMFCALSEEAEPGKYYFEGREIIPSKHATDPEFARRLWDVSEQFVGLK